MYDYENCIILVGLGSPISLYSELAEHLKSQLSNMSIQCLNWWECKDYGKALLDKMTRHTRSILIAHSAGGVIAMQALADAPQFIKRIVMLDTHASRNPSSLSSAAILLKSTLKNSNHEVKERVIKAYQPLIDHPALFDASLRFAVNWSNTQLDKTGEIIKHLPSHTALHIGFTDSNYEILDKQREIEQHAFWSQYNIDKQFILMNHFDLILPDQAKTITENILSWLNQSSH